MIRDPDEAQIHCGECNGYLFSCSVNELPAGGPIISCPMQKDPSGNCTGRYKNTGDGRGQA